ncbi:MAG: glycosyltransferase family 9 protein [Deltaproteobacteria bacterium]|nr:glycosyltransferase family 9 protein [Deltaproteobacteria bacterium]
MKPAFYRRQWDTLRQNPKREALDRLARQIALSFLDRYYFNDHHEAEYIRLLCEMATSFAGEELNKPGSAALFGIIVEGLCDDFEELQTEEYNRVISRVVDFCRHAPGGERLHRELGAFGLVTYDDLFKRIEGIRSRAAERVLLKTPPRRIILLSRVTIGADVAVTSVLVQRLMGLFPAAEIVLLGADKLAEIYGGNPRIRIREVAYSRRGNLVERFNSWFAVRSAIEDERKGQNDEEMIVIDPDSRLSQLGVLPVIDDDRYLFFNSRGSDAYPKKMSIAELANHWINEVLEPGPFCHPQVWLTETTLATAGGFAAALRHAGCRKLIVINLGVGGNARKRLGDAFEERMIHRLLQEPGTVILLDQGFGEEELARSRALIRSAQWRGVATEATVFGSWQGIGLSAGLVAVSAGIGEIAALIAHSDEFIGYDSACQHIAAALGVPTYTLFAGSNNPRFIRRWSPCGPNRSEIIHVDTLTHPPMFEIDDVITRLIDARAV